MKDLAIRIGSNYTYLSQIKNGGKPFALELRNKIFDEYNLVKKETNKVEERIEPYQTNDDIKKILGVTQNIQDIAEIKKMVKELKNDILKLDREFKKQLA